MKRLLGIVTLFITLAACSGDGEVRTAAITGEVTYLERIALPPGAQVQVTLRSADAVSDISSRMSDSLGRTAHTAFDGPGRILARHSSVVTASVPLPFTLHYNLHAPDPLRPMVIEAWISAGEQVLFASTEAMRVSVGSTASVRLTLRRPRHVALTCADGSRPSAAFPVMGELAFLEASGAAPVALRAWPAASGFHYGGDGYVLRGRGREALLRRPIGDETRCDAQPPSPLPISSRR